MQCIIMDGIDWLEIGMAKNQCPSFLRRFSAIVAALSAQQLKLRFYGRAVESYKFYGKPNHEAFVFL